MPLKIVETIEKGHPKLTIVPNSWEKNGLLRWPPPKQANIKLCMDETSKPHTDWLTMKCKVKRTGIPTYKRAEEELNLMMYHSDTEVADNEGRNHEINVDKTDSYNTLAEKLIFLHNNTEQTLSDVPGPSGVDPSLVVEEVYDYINSDVNLIATAVPDDLNNKIDQILSNQKILLDNQKTLMSNQFYLHESQKTLIEQEKKHCRELSNLAVLTEDWFSRLGRNKSSVVQILERDTFENQSFVIQPIANIKELEEMEQNLESRQHKHKLQQQYLLLCTTATGSGVNCSYKLLDIVFKREFLTTCSWSGGSRGDTVKVPLKKYKNILSFFYEMINTWDASYTQEDNEKFFKTILKNAVKRLQIKDLRTSTKRTRKDKVTSSGQQTTMKMVNIPVEQEEKNEHEMIEQVTKKLTVNSEIEKKLQESDNEKTAEDKRKTQNGGSEEDKNKSYNEDQLTGEENYKLGNRENSKTNTETVLQVTKEKTKEYQQEILKSDSKETKITKKNTYYKKSKKENKNADNQEFKGNIKNPMKPNSEEDLKGQMRNSTAYSDIESEVQESDNEKTTSDEHESENKDTEEDDNESDYEYQLSGEENYKSGNRENSKTNTKTVLKVNKEKVNESQQEILESDSKEIKITTNNLDYKISKKENINADYQEFKRNIEKTMKRKPEEDQKVKKKKSKLDTRDKNN